MYNYSKTQDSHYDPAKFAIHSSLRPEADSISNCGHIFQRTVSFLEIVKFFDEENIVTHVDFDCGLPFYSEAHTKVGQINREQENDSRSCEKCKCISSNNQNYCSIDKEHTSKIFLNPYSLWDMDPPALKSINHNNDRDSMPNQYPQPTTHQRRTRSYNNRSSDVLFIANDGQ